MKDLSIYIHFPFCVKKCNYCDFLSFPANEEARAGYVEALLSEIRLEAQKEDSYQVQTVFFGGGTPSLLTVLQMKAIMGTLRERFSFSENVEISVEVNPGTVTKEKLLGYKEAGINRLSIGLQSTSESELKELGRIHSYQAFLECYESAVAAGFTNINVDVMSALPGQSVESYRETLQKVMALKPAPTHISAYSLIVEEGTIFAERMEQGGLNLPSEDDERRMYEMTGELLGQNGYHRYEISNYAKAGYECKHNVVYWVRKDYLGLGLGAASLLGNVRRSNERDMDAYLYRVGQSAEADLPDGDLPDGGDKREKEVLSVQEQMEETFILGLRMMEGVSKQKFKETFGCAAESVFGPVIEKHVKNGLIQNDSHIKLTPRGIDVSNQVMVDFLL